MEQAWRWFGPDDPVTLDNVRQAGATGIVTALHDIPPGKVLPSDEIAKRLELIEAAGLRWSVCESIPVPDAIKRGGPQARVFIDVWKDSLANLGRAGVEVVCYNFMPVVDWTRTELTYPLPTKGLALRFAMADFAAYDVFVLKRPNAEAAYDAQTLASARMRYAAMDEAMIAALERTISAGLPGGAIAQTRESIGRIIASYEGIDENAMRANLRDFLREVTPVAEEFGMRLGVHTDDPPFSLFGLPRVVSTAADARRILSDVDSPANGLTFCVGSFGSRPDNDISAMVREFAPRIHFAHLRNVTLQGDRTFYEAEHLEGRADMVEIIDLLLAEERAAEREGRRPSIPMRPDHGHLLGDDVHKATNPGYSFAGRMKGLAELRGIMRTLERRKPH